jgi:hypothetical protein
MDVVALKKAEHYPMMVKRFADTLPSFWGLKGAQKLHQSLVITPMSPCNAITLYDFAL